MSRRAMAVAGDRGDLPFEPIYVGHAWSRHVKIDLVAISHKDNAVLLGECKWHRTRMGSDVLADLETRARKRRRIEGFKSTTPSRARVSRNSSSGKPSKTVLHCSRGRN